MARSRNIKPGFYANEELAECSVWARFIFPGLWMLADREGRLEDRGRRIKAALLPFDDVEIESLLSELGARGFIVRYVADDRALIQIVKFTKHQNPHHAERKSTLPAPAQEQPGNSLRLKPEASPGQASGGPETSPGQAPDEAQPRHGLALLIPDSGFLIPDSIEKQASPAEAPSGPATPPEQSKPMSAKEKVWTLGPEIIGGADAGARTFLGKLVKTHGEEVVSEALSACAIEQPGAARPWLLKACEAKSKVRASAKAGVIDLSGDDCPAWVRDAGFANRFEAGNEGCFPHNAREFADGKRAGATA